MLIATKMDTNGIKLPQITITRSLTTSSFEETTTDNGSDRSSNRNFAATDERKNGRICRRASKRLMSFPLLHVQVKQATRPTRVEQLPTKIGADPGRQNDVLDFTRRPKITFNLVSGVNTPRRRSSSDVNNVNGVTEACGIKPVLQWTKKKITIPFYSFQKDLLNKFRNAVKITIFCSRLFKEHCLR